MKFSKKELEAVLKITVAMASADGVVTEVETNFIAYELSRFGVEPAQTGALIDETVALPFETAISVIKSLDEEQKYYVCAFMAGVMSCDGEVDTTELRLWQYTCQLCSLPHTTLDDAIEYMHNLD
ncbi:MAG: TerB family tellurite resistance protein [Muribaculaceae bacterium]